MFKRNIKIDAEMHSHRENSGGAYVIYSPSNCKLITIETIRNLSVDPKTWINNEELVIEGIDKILKGINRPAVFLTTPSKDRARRIIEKFEVYYAYEVPIGYSNTNQWHICIRNPYTIDHYPRKPILYGGFNKAELLEKIVAIRDRMEKKNYKQPATVLKNFYREVTEFINKIG